MISVERSYVLGGMTPAKTDSNTAIAQEVLQAFDDINPTQPGFRPAHAKGILLAGRFTPSPGAASLTRAPHLKRSTTRVTVRFLRRHRPANHRRRRPQCKPARNGDTVSPRRPRSHGHHRSFGGRIPGSNRGRVPGDASRDPCQRTGRGQPHADRDLSCNPPSGIGVRPNPEAHPSQLPEGIFLCGERVPVYQRQRGEPIWPLPNPARLMGPSWN